MVAARHKKTFPRQVPSLQGGHQQRGRRVLFSQSLRLTRGMLLPLHLDDDNDQPQVQCQLKNQAPRRTDHSLLPEGNPSDSRDPDENRIQLW